MSIQRVILAALFVAPLAVQAAEPEPTASVEVDLRAEILVAIQLPTLAHTMRVSGVPEVDVEATLVSFRETELHAGAAATALVAANEAVERKGPVENFGAFVKAELAAGKRGKDLAASIKTEHKKRGIGKGKKLAKWKDPRGNAGGDDSPDEPDGSDDAEPESEDGPPGKAKGHDDDGPPGKAKGHDKAKADPPGKAKGHGGDGPPGKAKGHDDDGPPGKAKGHDKGKDDPPGKAEGHDKPPPG
jgi:hypothetical protein